MRKVNVKERLEYLRIQKRLKKRVSEAETYLEWTEARDALEKHEGNREDISTRYVY